MHRREHLGLLSVAGRVGDGLVPDIQHLLCEDQPELVHLRSDRPEELRPDDKEVIEVDSKSYEGILVKAADKISAYIKCIEEMRSGNKEFAKAEKSLKKAVEAYFCYDEVKYFCETFIDSFKKTLDELE